MSIRRQWEAGVGPTTERQTKRASLAFTVKVVDMLQLPLAFGRWERDIDKIMADLLPCFNRPKQTNAHHRPLTPGKLVAKRRIRCTGMIQ
jgi:hypothetical protein